MNPSDISRLSWYFLTLLTAACQSPDECQRYDLPHLYWDCLTLPSSLIHPQENPNALIPRGNNFFSFTIYLAMIYWLWLPPSQRITDPFWEIRFSHLSWVCMWRRSQETVRGGRGGEGGGGGGGDWLWGAAVCESLRCHSSAANGMPSGCPCDSLLLFPCL